MSQEPRRVEPAIRVDRLDKTFRRIAAGHKLRTLKSALLERSLIGGLRPEDAIPALKGIDFEVAPGEAIGLIGSNGSGKSTLLRILAGILRPTSGTVDIVGRVAALIELGAAFHPEISGRENIFINGAVLGLSRREIAERYDEIVAFSGLEDFVDEPVKNYSSGMYSRLGFAIAIFTEPDILLVDEVLSVGDEAFAHKCLRRIEEFLARGKTLILVSHSLPLIESVCDRALWIEKGVLRLDGHPRRVVDAYRQSVAENEGREHREAKEQRERADQASPADAAPADSRSVLERRADTLDADTLDGEDTDRASTPSATGNGATSTDTDTGTSTGMGTEAADAAAPAGGEVLRWGSGEAKIDHLRILVADEERYHVHSGDAVTFEVGVIVEEALSDFVFGIAINTPRGVECWGTNTDLEGFVPSRLDAGRGVVTVACPALHLGPGEYLVDVAVHAKDGTPYDYRRQLAAFTVTAAQGGIGVYFPAHAWRFSPGIDWDRTPEPT